jgi:hypothetical protein
MKRILVRVVPMHEAADAAPFRSLCVVHLNSWGEGVMGD